MKKNKRIIFAGIAFVVIIIAGGIYFQLSKNNTTGSATNKSPSATPKPRVNIVDISERPYVTLQPLSDRNVLELSIHNLPKKADSVEVLLEYDRNKGILDAVLKNYKFDKIPYVNQIFLGSKSSGGHTTYHEDVVGGSMTLTFSGDEPYSLQIPWRYDDTQPHYTDLASSDAKFQLVLDAPLRTPKVLVMQSPGLPAKLEGKVIAGPYLVRGVGPLPESTAKLTIHLENSSTTAQLYGFNGQKWQKLDSTVDNRTLSASVPLVDTYVVME